MRLDHTVPLVALLAVLASVVALAAVQGQSPAQPVFWSAALERPDKAVRPGGSVTLLVIARIDEGWHVYGTDELPAGPRPLRVALAAGQPFAAGKLEAPDPIRELDPAFEQVTAFYDKTTTFRLPVRLSPKAKPGKSSIAIEVGFQACDGRICLPSRTVKLSVSIDVQPGRPLP